MVGDGFRVHNFFPSDPDIGMSGMSPFFLLDYGSKYYFPPATGQRGVGVHPHKGFETVTIAYHGSVAHHDSAGNKGVIHEGDVQWMTASSGILHKEYHAQEFTRQGGIFQMVQLWVNLPARFKSIPPKYQAITKEDIVRHVLKDHVSTVGIIAGEYSAETGPASTFTPISLFDVRLRKGTATEFRFPVTYNTGMLVIEGKIKVNISDVAPEDHFILMGNEGEHFDIEALEDSIILIMSGEPIDEPIVARGPFLMNTSEEIQEAYAEFRTGKFGFLED